MSKKISPKFQPAVGPNVAYAWGLADVCAVKALADGIADEVQQKRVFELILNVSAIKEQDVYPGDHGLTDFAGGKRFVGLQFAWSRLVSTEEFKQTKEKRK